MKFRSRIVILYSEVQKFGLQEVAYRLGSKLHLISSAKYKEIRNSYFQVLNEDERRVELEEWYRKSSGKNLNLDCPTSFNEMIQWQKLFNTTPLKTRLADKYLVRDWVKEQIGEDYLIPIYGAWDSYDEIDFSAIPPQTKFVLKANHGTEMTMIIPSKEAMNQSKTKKKVDDWMQTVFGWDGMELQYIGIPHKVIAEQYIEQPDGDLVDYKIHCFHGVPKVIWTVGKRDLEHHTGVESYYDTEWNKIDVSSGIYSLSETGAEKPARLSEMLSIAEKLSKGFSYVRVDLYLLEDGIKFGEMTFTPSNGTMKSQDILLTQFVDEGMYTKES